MMTSSNWIIEVSDLTKKYGGLTALRGGGFKIAPGEIVALLGPNGAGKTTMMKIITGFLEPTSGQVSVDGLSIATDRLAVQKRIGYLPENAPIYGDMLVQDYLIFAGRLRGIAESDMRGCLADAVQATGLKEVLTRPIGVLSKGFKQRVGLAQAILHRPKLLILDEPTNGLDPTQIVEIRHLIKRLAQNSTVMLSTHILSEAEATCGRAIIIINGEIRADARLSELAESSEVILTLAQNSSQNARIVEELTAIDGVGKVAIDRSPEGNYQRFRLSGTNADHHSQELALKIFSFVSGKGYPVCELRPESKTLETVFKELALKTDISVEAQA